MFSIRFASWKGQKKALETARAELRSETAVNGALLINIINNPAQEMKVNESARHQNVKIWRDPENRDEWAQTDLTRTNAVGAKTGSVTCQDKTTKKQKQNLAQLCYIQIQVINMLKTTTILKKYYILLQSEIGEFSTYKHSWIHSWLYPQIEILCSRMIFNSSKRQLSFAWLHLPWLFFLRYYVKFIHVKLGTKTVQSEPAAPPFVKVPMRRGPFRLPCVAAGVELWRDVKVCRRHHVHRPHSCGLQAPSQRVCEQPRQQLHSPWPSRGFVFSAATRWREILKLNLRHEKERVQKTSKNNTKKTIIFKIELVLT